MSTSLKRMAAVLLLGALALLPSRSAADVHPNTAPGFPGDQSFHVGDVDNVNLFNGALTITLPIGINYPVNGGFSYGLKLVYNSTPWQFKQIKYLLPPDDHEVTRTAAEPNPCSNAGLGWRVSLGRFNPPCQVPDSNDQLPGPVYQDENGTDHVFYGTLHDGDDEDAAVAGVQDIQYTRDGSYLRMKLYTDGTRDVEFPDGTVRKFNAAGLLTKISDRFGNRLSVSYGTNQFGASQWTLTDNQNRTHTIVFRTAAPAGVIDTINLQVSGGTATYTFSYSEQTVGRACPHNDNDQPNLSVGPTAFVPLLTSVTLPDGSSWTSPVSDYITATPTGNCTDHGGNLKALGLPTRGRLEWAWQYYTFPSGSSNKPHQQQSSGVATRTMRDFDGTTLGTWTYVSAPIFPGAGTAKEHTTTVTDPLGHKTIHYFSVALDNSWTGWNRYDYSLPFTRNQPLNVAAGVDLYRSRQVYNSAGTLLRSEYVLYERDPVSGVDPPSSTNTNRRMLRSRTVYEDDASKYGGVINSGFDGLGHYRQQQTEGNFGGSNVRTRFANHNPARGTYTVNLSTNTGTGYSLLPASGDWILEAPSYVSDSEGGAAAVTDLCYSPGTAAVVRKRVHRQDGTTKSATDLVTVYQLDTATGNVTSEKSYGGDAQAGIPTGTADPCTMTLPASPEVQIDHTYTSGVRSNSKYTGTTFFALNQGIDGPSGLVTSSADTAGVWTDYEYDKLGRLTWSKPREGGGWTEYVYTPASTGTRANVIVRRRATGSKTATILAVDQLIFDGFGRLYQEQKKLPSGLFNKRETLYDNAGNKASVSEWTTGQPANKTFYLGYDPFGRPTTIRPPDGAAHDVSLSYTGTRQVSRTVKIATAAGVESSATTTEVYDLHGRLLSVTEPSGANGANVTTNYGYDVGNRLASVSTTATVSGTSVTQTRSFDYDRAGLLKSETHPEKGASGNGTVTYPRYDSRGHALRKVDGANDLTFTYDAAERLTQVQETGGSARVLKAFSYATANGTGDWRLGKLRTATRYNYVTMSNAASTVQVTETYTYGGKDGRVSVRDTAVTKDGVNAASFTQGFTYNDLGLVSALDYPRCTHSGCTQLPPAIFGDVPVGDAYQLDVEAIYPNITAGCSTTPRLYCPTSPVTRGQMAVFLLRAKEGPAYVPPACQGLFADMSCGNSFTPWAEELYRRGITTGCIKDPLQYCPDQNVTNAQMAVFLIQTMGGLGSSTVSTNCTADPYPDVSCSTNGAALFIAEEARRGITTGCGNGQFCPNAEVKRNEMARLMVRAFDIPLALDPNTQRSVQFAYSQGLLSTVKIGATAYGTLSYHPNLLVSQIVRNNGITDTQANDPNEMRRPASLAASGTDNLGSWSTGTYAYDGAGNIKTIGTSAFTYDKVNRLVAATIYDGPTGGGTQKQQTYTFDAFGNLTNIGGNNGRTTPTAPQTNRLNGSGTAYDAAGNLTNWNLAVYEYDRFNQMTRMLSGSEKAVSVYTADDERIWSSDELRNVSHWTLRDLGGKVLRDYQNNGRWTLYTDYLYRNGLLLAAETQTGQRHFHLDHLGTPRLITKGSGYYAAYHAYYPFGEEATAIAQDSERMKFTGHERDLGNTAANGDDLDYMHARHESPVTGRFLSFDIGPVDYTAPQSWNRYLYALDNPIRYVDGNGQRAEEPDGLFKKLYDLALGYLSKAFSPQRAPRNDPNVEALKDSDVGSNPNVLPKNQAALVQQGLNEGGAALAAGGMFIGIQAGEVWLTETLSGYRVGANATLEKGTLDVNVFALKSVSEGRTLRGLLGTFEKEAGRIGAERLVIRGTLAKEIFQTAAAQALAKKLGYTFELLANGTVIISKNL